MICTTMRLMTGNNNNTFRDLLFLLGMALLWFQSLRTAVIDLPSHARTKQLEERLDQLLTLSGPLLQRQQQVSDPLLEVETAPAATIEELTTHSSVAATPTTITTSSLAAMKDSNDYNTITIPTIPTHRRDRFPSVEERIRIYLGDWYIPPCENNTQGFTHVHIHGQDVYVWNQYRKPVVIKKEPALASIWAGYPKVFEQEARGKRTRNYCKDLTERMIPALDRIGWTFNKNTSQALPIFVQFGDYRHSKKHGYVNMPQIKKFRASYTAQQIDVITKQQPACHSTPRPILRNNELEAIIWKLNSERHYNVLPSISQSDVPWHEKKNKGVFRGKNTGKYNNFPNHLARCFAMDRCRVTYQLANSTLVDAKLTTMVSDHVNGVPMTAKSMPISEQLKYKAIVMIEGVDVATGLKWALYSNSVVLMKPPTRTTFAMEERLEPWVHYVPLNDALTDVEEKMQWVLDHDAHAQAIAQRATLWIEDLLYHKDADADNARIEDEIMRRYKKQFIMEPTKPTDEEIYGDQPTWASDKKKKPEE